MVNINDNALYTFDTLDDAVANANRWAGRCSIITLETGRGVRWQVVSGNCPWAVYVTLGTIWLDWSKS